MSDLPSWARVGAKVVCVDTQWWGEGSSGLVYGRTYTIVSVHVLNGTATMPDGSLSFGHLVVELLEATNPEDHNYPEMKPGFALVRFRPLVSLEDDIATHFEHHLHNDHRAPETVA